MKLPPFSSMAGGGAAVGDGETEGSLEGDEQPEPDDSEQDADAQLLGEEFENSLTIASDHGGGQPNEVLVIPKSSAPLQLITKF
jgi:hypothetical protein